MFRLAAVVAVLSVVVKLVGFVREQLTAVYFGASIATDAYVIGSLLPNLTGVVLASGVSSAFLPAYTELRERAEARAAAQLNAGVFVLTMLVGAAAGLAGIATTSWVLRIVAPGLEGAGYEMAVDAARISYGSVLFIMLGAFFKSLLHAHGDTTFPTWAGLGQNLVMVGLLPVLVSLIGASALPLGFAIGLVIYMLLQWFWVHRRQVAWEWHGLWVNPALYKVVRLAIPVVLGNLITQAATVAERGMASHLSSGSASALSFADKIRQIPMGLWVAVVSSVLFPTLSRLVASGNRQEFAARVSSAYRGIIIATMPMVILLAILSRPVVRVLYQHGAFSAADTSVTAAALASYAPGIVGLVLTGLLDFALWSMHDVRTPLAASIVVTVLNVGLDMLLIGPLGHVGLALGASVAIFGGVAVESWRLTRSNALVVRKTFGDVPKLVLASGILGGVTYLGRTWGGLDLGTISTLRALIGLALVGVIAIASYILALRVMGITFIPNFKASRSPSAR